MLIGYIEKHKGRTMKVPLFAILISSILALGYALFRALWISRQPSEGETLKRISGYIAGGAMTFLSREYRILLPFILIVAVFLGLANRGILRFQALSFSLGAVCSALGGYIGMRVATKANSRTTHAATIGLADALKVSFAGGSVMGMSVVGLALLGIFLILYSSLYLFSGHALSLSGEVLPILSGFSLGASSIALFSRVGGGIFTKAADIGADLVGKLEAGIPEDDPRNPATIADNVGDNVGDVAGMGADLFESYVGSLVGCMILAQSAIASDMLRIKLTGLPLMLSAVGVLASLAGILLVRVRTGGSPQRSLNAGSFTAAFIAAATAYPVCRIMVDREVFGGGVGANQIFFAFIIGIASGVVIGIITEYFTGTGKRPVNSLVKACETGPATNLIAGIGIGMFSCFPIVIVIAFALFTSYLLSGFYGVGTAALGMLSTLGIQLAVDAYGPIADNAGGLAEMAEYPPEVRKITDRLDAVGNTTAAVGKGFAIGSAGLTAFILFAAFKEQVGAEWIDLISIYVLTGVLLGAVIPYLFSSMAMNAVGKAAFAMIREVRRQFQEKPGILSGAEAPDYDSCIAISASSALRKMLPPGIMAIAIPVIVGFLGGVQMLLGLLVGVTISGVILSVFMSNSGSAWDNAKKTIETGAGGGKGSESHMASIVGDTVGDPFKDTAGPSLNILIKIMAVVSLVIAPLLKNYWGI
jgi:K(+)-stimulated pyrophosphate-energized sodium pump